MDEESRRWMHDALEVSFPRRPALLAVREMAMYDPGAAAAMADAIDSENIADALVIASASTMGRAWLDLFSLLEDRDRPEGVDVHANEVASISGFIHSWMRLHEIDGSDDNWYTASPDPPPDE